MLVGAMNPCLCGWFGDSQHECTCSMATVTRYQKRLSGPLLDRIDIHVEVPRVDFDKLSDRHRGETSQTIRGRIEAALDVQRRRFASLADERSVTTNADMGPGEIREFCPVDEAGHSLLRAAMRQLHMSARAYHRSCRRGTHRDGASGRGDPVPAALASVMMINDQRYRVPSLAIIAACKRL